ncbi:hypothetical protein [Sphingobacterium sp. NPDC055431]
MATGIPEKTYQKYFKDLHANRGGRLKGGLGKTSNVLGTFGLEFDLFSSDPHALGIQFSAGSELNTLYYVSDSKLYFVVNARSNIKDGKGKVIGTKMTYTTFEGYFYNKTTRKYEGVNKLDTYEAVRYEGEAARHYLQELVL